MTRSLAIVAALAVSLAAGGASAQKLDAQGKCRDAKGHYAKIEVCKAAPAPAGKCRDIKTKKFAKCGLPNTEAVPTKK